MPLLCPGQLQPVPRMPPDTTPSTLPLLEHRAWPEKSPNGTASAAAATAAATASVAAAAALAAAAAAGPPAAARGPSAGPAAILAVAVAVVAVAVAVVAVGVAALLRVVTSALLPEGVGSCTPFQWR